MDFSYSNLDQTLLNAYLQTRYCIDEPSLCIQIGRLHPTLDALLSNNNSNCWVFITAWNPKSKKLKSAENQQRQARLLQHIAALGKIYFTGRGEPTDNQWEAEESLLVLDLSKTEGIALAQRFQQQAIVYGALEKVATLVIIPEKM